MKKRILSLALTIALVLTLLPVLTLPVLAADGDAEIDISAVRTGDVDTHANWSYDFASNTYTITGDVSVTGTVSSGGPVSFIIENDKIVTWTASYNGDVPDVETIRISGEGTFNVTSGTITADDPFKATLLTESSSKLIVSGSAEIIATSGSGIAIQAQGEATIAGGAITSPHIAIWMDSADLTISDGTITGACAIACTDYYQNYNTLEITGGTITSDTGSSGTVVNNGYAIYCMNESSTVKIGTGVAINGNVGIDYELINNGTIDGYLAIFTNITPTTSGNVTGGVYRVPSAPADMSVTAGSTTAVVTWNVPVYNNSSITGYKVIYGPTYGGTNALKTVTTTSTSVTLTNLTPSTDYMISIYSVYTTDPNTPDSNFTFGGIRTTDSTTLPPVTPADPKTETKPATEPQKDTVQAAPATAAVAEKAADAVENAAEKAAQTSGTSITAAGAPVTLSVGGNNTVATFALPNDADTGSITTMAILNEDGTLTPIPTRIDANGNVIVLVSGDNLTLVPLCVEADFSDISGLSQAVQDEIERAAALMIIEGRGEGVFDPTAKVTNQEAAAMFLRALGVPVDFDTAVEKAAEHGMVSADAVGGAPMSRIATAELIVGALMDVGIANEMTLADAAAILAGFTDLEGLSDDEMTAMAICVKLGIFKGHGDGTMGPNDTLLRSQMASLAVRLQDIILGV